MSPPALEGPRLGQLDLNKLHVLASVAERGGVSAAARTLALTPSAVSQSLSALEASLDVQLFDRVGRGLALTREGRVLQAQLAELLPRLQGAIDEASGSGRAVRGTVRLGVFLGFPRTPLARLVAGFAKAHDETATRIVYGARGELETWLAAGRIDFALAFGARPALRRLAATRHFEQELVLVAGAAHYRRGFDLDALSQTPIVDYYQAEPLIGRWVWHHYRRKAPRLRVCAWAATTNLVLELVLAGAGVGVVPRHVAAPHLGRKRLRLIGSRQRELVDSIWLLERARGFRGPALEAFREAALEQLPRLAS